MKLSSIQPWLHIKYEHRAAANLISWFWRHCANACWLEAFKLSSIMCIVHIYYEVLLLTISCSVSRQAVTRWTPSRPPGKPSRHTRHTCRLKSSGRGKVWSLTARKINRLCLFLGWLVITCHSYLKSKLFAYLQILKAQCQLSTVGVKPSKTSFITLLGCGGGAGSWLVCCGFAGVV